MEIQIHAAGFEVLDGVEQVAQRAPHSVDCPSHNDIEAPSSCVLEHGIEARASVSSLGTRDARIAVDLDHIPPASPGHLPKLTDLIFHGLCVGAHSHRPWKIKSVSFGKWPGDAGGMWSR